MIDIKRKEDCCGCGACFDVCAKKAILWERDREGFSYPHVDANKCVNCGLCNKVCPIENSETINQTNTSVPVIIGVYHKDDDVRVSSTSGGAFWGLAESWVKSGGYVAGAVFYEHFKVQHIVTNDIEELKRIKGSKYTQSDCRNMYRDIASLLKKGERVMATGLPCQMAGLKQYLRKDYDNLLLVNVICHSVSSPMAFEKYVEFLEKKYNSKMVSYHPKNKDYGGWHKFAFKAEFENGKVYVGHLQDDYYTHIFVGKSHLLTRPSCYECRFKHFPQPTDITIGDFWGIEGFDVEFDSPKGVSLVMLNSRKGLNYFNSIDCFISKEYDADTAIYNNKRNASIRFSVSKPDYSLRDRCIDDFQWMDFDRFVKRYFLPKKKCIVFFKRLISKLYKS